MSRSPLRSVSAWRAYLPIGAAAVVLSLPPIWLSGSRLWMGIAVTALLFGMYAVAFNIIFGSTGQLFLCVGALAGVGGYLNVILADQVGIPAAFSVVVAAAASSLLGAIFSWVAVRRRLDVIFTGIVTLAFSLSYSNFVLGARNLTGGETGLRVSVGGGTILRERVQLYFVFLALLSGYLVVYRLLHRSHIGWAFRALRDDEVAAELVGIDVARYRIYAGAIGSGMLGLAGAVYAMSEGFIGPSTFAFGDVDIPVLVMLAFGGIGSALGPIFGAVTFTVLGEFLVEFGQLRDVIYGALVLALFLGFRHGIVPAIDRLARRAVERAGGR